MKALALSMAPRCCSYESSKKPGGNIFCYMRFWLGILTPLLRRVRGRDPFKFSVILTLWFVDCILLVGERMLISVVRVGLSARLYPWLWPR